MASVEIVYDDPKYILHLSPDEARAVRDLLESSTRIAPARVSVYEALRSVLGH